MFFKVDSLNANIGVIKDTISISIIEVSVFSIVYRFKKESNEIISMKLA